jgi:alpha-mannosidase
MTPKPGVRYQFQDLGLQRFTLALLPHRGTWADAGLTRAATELNQRPTVLLESSHPGRLPDTASYGTIEPDNLVLGAVKAVENGEDLIVRVVETCGRPAHGVVDLPLWQRRFEVDVKPFEIRTFRISRDPDVEVEETDLLERALAVDGESSEGAAGITARSGGSYSPL